MSRRIRKQKKDGPWRSHRKLWQEPLNAEDWREVYEFMRCVQLPFLWGVVEKAWRRVRKCQCGGSVTVDAIRDFIYFECEDCGHKWNEKHRNASGLVGT